MYNHNKVMLINAPSTCNIHHAANTTCFPHLGIVNIGTRIQKKCSHIDVRIVDGGIKTTNEILHKIDSYKPTVLGISVLTPTYSEGLKIAQYAKEKYGSTIVLGNDHACFFPEIILSRRGYIDYIIKNDMGERPFVELLEALKERIPIEMVSSLVYRSKDRIASNPVKKYSLTDLAEEDIPNLDLLGSDFEQFVTNYRNKFGRLHKGEVIPVTINNVRGCGNGRRRCTYCSIYDLNLNYGNPEQFWSIVLKYKEKGINLFFEVADSFTTFRRYIDQLIASRPFNPKQEGIEFMIYGRAQDIAYNTKLVEQLKELNVVRVNIGLDSGNQEMLISQRKGNRKGKEIETNTKAVQLLQNAEITIHASFVAGALGETRQTLEDTVRYIENLMTNNGFSSIEFSKHVPLPNSPTWDLLLTKTNSEFYDNIDGELRKHGIEIIEDVRRELRKKYGWTDELNIHEMARDWITHFTHVDYEELLRVIQETNRKIEEHSICTGDNVG